MIKIDFSNNTGTHGEVCIYTRIYQDLETRA